MIGTYIGFTQNTAVILPYLDIHFCEEFFDSGQGISVHSHHFVVLHEDPVDPDGSEGPGREVRDVVILKDKDVDLGNSGLSQSDHGLGDPLDHAVGAPNLDSAI